MGQAPVPSAVIAAHLTSSYTNRSIVIDRDEDKVHQGYQRGRKGDSPGIWSSYGADMKMHRTFVSYIPHIIHFKKGIVVLMHLCNVPASLDPLSDS